MRQRYQRGLDRVTKPDSRQGVHQGGAAVDGLRQVFLQGISAIEETCSVLTEGARPVGVDELPDLGAALSALRLVQGQG
jgi:hypothetical protein